MKLFTSQPQISVISDHPMVSPMYKILAGAHMHVSVGNTCTLCSNEVKSVHVHVAT